MTQNQSTPTFTYNDLYPLHGGRWIRPGIIPSHKTLALPRSLTKFKFCIAVSTYCNRIAIMPILLLVSSCGGTDTNKFTLKTEMPANFKLEADAYYVPATGEHCSAPPRRRGYFPDRKFFTSETQTSDYTAVFHIPLKITAGGCPLVLNSLKLDIEGKWGPGTWDINGVTAGISIRDDLPDGNQNSANMENTVLDGECQWYFRTIGPRRALIKVLKCSAIDKSGHILKRSPGGSLHRNTLSSQTISMAIRVADKELPYFNGYWFKTDAGGWKPCDGKSGRAMEERCLNPPRFKNLILPDGRECSVYPMCTE